MRGMEYPDSLILKCQRLDILVPTEISRVNILRHPHTPLKLDSLDSPRFHPATPMWKFRPMRLLSMVLRYIYHCHPLQLY
jgi:hypothetical protein